MTEVFEAKVRKVGNSLGIIIPKEISELLGFDHGDTIHVAIPSTDLKNRNKKLLALIGIDRGKEPFKREKEDRF
jgi:antitoxin component of MazEF toxin-antitoxin module